MKSFLRVLVFAVLLGLLTGATVYFYTPIWAEKSLELEKEALVELRKGTSLRQLSEDLERQGVIESSLLFRIWMKFNRNYSKFQAGLYRFAGTVSPKDVVSAMENGKVYEPIALQFVIPEGFTLSQVIDRLAAKGVGTHAEFEKLVRDEQLLKKFGIKGPNVEGFLYPATYTFRTMPTPQEVLEVMLQKFFNSLPKGLEDELKSVNLDLFSAITMASLIERETQLDEERGMIAEVIWNRLKAGEPLGIDAALIYGIKDYKGDIKWEHLKDAGNPYNNRIHKGLPPTPIGAISMGSLSAVFRPTSFGYRYYVLANDGSKHHRFSKTLEEHNVYVKQLIDTLR